MPMISLKCPNCGADLEANESLERIQCNYCGTVSVLSEAIAQKQVLDESHKLKPFLELAESSMASRDYARCAEYADKAIEIDGTNAYAWFLKGCGAEGVTEGSGEIFFEKAKSYCTDDVLRSRIESALANPDSVVRRPSRKLKIDAGAADKRFGKDKFSIYIDKEKVAAVKGGETTSVPISMGKHEVSLKVNSGLLKDFKRKIAVDDSNYKLKIVRNKDKTYSFDLDEF